MLADPCDTFAAFCLPDDPVAPVTVTPVCPDDPSKMKWIVRNWSDTEIELNWSISGGESGTLFLPGKEAGESYHEVVFYTDAVAGTNVLDYYDGHSIKGSAESIDCEDTLSVAPVCTDVPDKRKWVIRNTIDNDITVTWSVYGTDQQGTLDVPGQVGDEPYGEATLYTDPVHDIDTIVVIGEGETHTAESTDEECIPPPPTEIIPVCTDVAGKNKWIIRYYHEVGTTVTWSVNGGAQTGTLELDGVKDGETYSETVLYTDATEEINTIIVASDAEEYIAESTDEECIPPPSIEIVPVCTDVEGKNKWIIRYNQDVGTTVTWSVYGDSQKGTIDLDGTEGDEEYTETVLYTDKIDEIDVITVELDGEVYESESSDEECLPPPPKKRRSSGSSGSLTDRTPSEEDDADTPDTKSDRPEEAEPKNDPRPLPEPRIEEDSGEEQQDEGVSTHPTDDPELPVEKNDQRIIAEEPIGEQMPNTSTPWYNILVTSVLAMAGSGYYLWRKKFMA